MSKETSACHSEGPPEESLRPSTSMNFLFLSRSPEESLRRFSCKVIGMLHSEDSVQSRPEQRRRNDNFSGSRLTEH